MSRGAGLRGKSLGMPQRARRCMIVGKRESEIFWKIHGGSSGMYKETCLVYLSGYAKSIHGSLEIANHGTTTI